MLQGTLTIGDGAHSFGTLNATDFPSTHQLWGRAFALSTHVHVLPGVYRAPQQPVVVAQDDVHVEGSSGAVLLVGTGPIGLFHVTGRRFTLAGVTVMVEMPVAAQHVLRLEAHDARLDRVAFDVHDGGDPLQPTHLVRVAGPAPIRGFTMERCRVHPARGICTLTANRVYEAVVRDNTVSPRDGTVALSGRVFDLEDFAFGQIAGNVIRNLGTGAERLPGVIRVSSSGPEEHHLRIVDNTLEQCAVGVEGVLRLEGLRFSNVVGNMVGRIVNPLGPAIQLLPGSGITGGQNAVIGNQVHNVGAATVTALHVEGSTENRIAQNVFSLCHGPQVSLGSGADGVTLEGNDFRAPSDLAAVFAILHGQGAVDWTIRDNTARCIVGQWAGVVAPVTGGTSTVTGNLNY